MYQEGDLTFCFDTKRKEVKARGAKRSRNLDNENEVKELLYIE